MPDLDQLLKRLGSHNILGSHGSDALDILDKALKFEATLSISLK
jgi:hypothetical protein